MSFTNWTNNNTTIQGDLNLNLEKGRVYADFAAYTFDGVSFTLKDSVSSGTAIAVWGDGTYIYEANGGITAITFDGTYITELASRNDGGTAMDVWGDGTYVYLATQADGLKAYVLIEG